MGVSAGEEAVAVQARPAGEPLIELRNLVVEYVLPDRRVRAVDDVSLSINPGEIVGLAGESGCGKSTTANAIMRILRPPAEITSGSVLFQGEDMASLKREELRRFRWRHISLVFQSAMDVLNPVMRVGDQFVDMLQAHEQVKKSEALARAGDLLEEIEELKRELGFAVLFITHDLSLLVEFSDRIAIMYAGEIVESAPSRLLFRHPQHPYTVGLMNSFPPLTGPIGRLTGIPGSPPDLAKPPSGCRFNPRCPHCNGDDQRLFRLQTGERPRLRAVETDHLVACHLVEQP